MSIDAKAKLYIHYEPTRIEYTVSENELNDLRDSSMNSWKDFCIVCGSVGLPCLLNAITETWKMPIFSLDLPLFLNYLFGSIGIILFIIFGILWRNTNSKCDSIITAIKRKPRWEFTPDTMNVGALPEPPIMIDQ